MIETHVLEVRMPLRTEYLGFDSAEAARGTAYSALQSGSISYEGIEEKVPAGTQFRVLTKHSLTIEKMFNRG